MNAEVRAPVLNVGWKVNALAASIASVRYRAALPLVALESDDLHGRVFASGLDSNLDGLDVLVIVKSFTPDDLRLAQLAAERGIRVVFDLCDNVFVGHYGQDAHVGTGLSPAQMLHALAPYLSCVVTTTQPLADVVRSQLPHMRVEVIPDGIETGDVAKRIGAVLTEAKVRARAERAHALKHRIVNVLRRVRVEGPALLPALALHAARRVARMVLRPVRNQLRKWRAAPPVPTLEVLHASATTRRILWFGNHGAEHARFGMLDILEYREALERLAQERDVELVVVSNNREKYEKRIRPLAIRSHYVEWSPRAVADWLRHAAAVIVPNTLDPFSICKSANRTVLAMAYGVPVVATMTPALHSLGDYLHTESPLDALRRVLDEPEAERERALAGYRRAEELFGSEATRFRWQQLLQDLPPPQAPGRRGPAPEVAVVLHLVQDLDLALPILQEARAAGLAWEAWCSSDAIARSPRVLATLERERLPFHLLPGPDGLREFRFDPRTRALLTIAETNLGPHRVPRLLTTAAQEQGVFTATMQHGFENVALTYEDHLHGFHNVTIAAQRIYTWGSAETLHPRVTASVRERCVPVGCPKRAVPAPADLGDLLPAGRPVIGIFENLHWHRYSDAYRRAFLDAVMDLAQAFPEVVFLVKPHHAGIWLTKRYEGERPSAANLVIADPQLPQWESHTAATLLGRMAGAITTPSTVALDAARMGLPCAVVAGGLDLHNYRPLTLLAHQREWAGFVGQALDPQGSMRLRDLSAGFVERVLVPGDGARRIVEDLHAVVRA